MKLNNTTIVLFPILLSVKGVYSAFVNIYAVEPSRPGAAPTATRAQTSIFTNLPTALPDRPTRRQSGPIFPNPISFVIPSSATASVNCLAEAAFVQQAIFTFPGSQFVTFQGNGFFTPMPIVGSGSKTFISPPRPSSYTVTAQFQYTTDFPKSDFQDAIVGSFNVSGNTITIGSEDSVDGDNNDTVATIKINPGAFPPPTFQCPAESVLQCCNSVQPANNANVGALLGLLGITPSGSNQQVGVTCTPITVVGVGASSCSAQVVCCGNANFNGLVALDCAPAIINS